jgi:hypothetical protein
MPNVTGVWQGILCTAASFPCMHLHQAARQVLFLRVGRYLRSVVPDQINQSSPQLTSPHGMPMSAQLCTHYQHGGAILPDSTLYLLLGCLHSTHQSRRGRELAGRVFVSSDGMNMVNMGKKKEKPARISREVPPCLLLSGRKFWHFHCLYAIRQSDAKSMKKLASRQPSLGLDDDIRCSPMLKSLTGHFRWSVEYRANLARRTVCRESTANCRASAVYLVQ